VFVICFPHAFQCFPYGFEMQELERAMHEQQYADDADALA